MLTITLDKQAPTPLVEQIISEIRRRIDEHALRSNTRLPSIRQFATQHRVSRFTVVQAFDRLVATGYLHSRPGSGFYVSPRPTAHENITSPVQLERAMDTLWLLRNALTTPRTDLIPGAGWLPHQWMDEDAVQRSLRQLAKHAGSHLTSYGQPEGYLPLRQLLQSRLGDIGVAADSRQILLTNGATHALDLIVRYYVRPGDTVLVDDPGYFILFGALKSHGAKVVGVPWNTDGPDIESLERLIKEHQPNVFFTNSILHNPTGASISQAIAYRVLQLAEKYDLVIVEDDVYGDFHPQQQSRLATLDQLQRVIYISSYSKTLSAAMRVGYIAGKPELIQQLADLKLISGLTTAELNERLIYQMLTDGYYRKYLDKLHKRLQQEKERAIESFDKIGLSPVIEPQGGMFMWIEMPPHIDVVKLVSTAAQQGITLAPGNLFRPHHEPSQGIRFNIASCNESKNYAFIKSQINDG
ncbi:PLP-dependent aminotransferase family protein [Pseudomonadota bacterium]